LDFENDDEDDSSPLLDFLKLECKPSVLRDEYIIVNHLKKSYHKFCSERQIEAFSQFSLVSAKEIHDFGARYEPEFSIKYINGI
jgi:hypothetical protein